MNVKLSSPTVYDYQGPYPNCLCKEEWYKSSEINYVSSLEGGKANSKKKIQIFLKLDLIFLDIKQIAKQEIVHEIIR